jgi:hypothetical protein
MITAPPPTTTQPNRPTPLPICHDDVTPRNRKQQYSLATQKIIRHAHSRVKSKDTNETRNETSTEASSAFTLALQPISNKILNTPVGRGRVCKDCRLPNARDWLGIDFLWIGLGLKENNLGAGRRGWLPVLTKTVHQRRGGGSVKSKQLADDARLEAGVYV